MIIENRKKIHIILSLALACMLFLCLFLPAEAQASGSHTATIPISNLVQGDLPSTAETFTYTISAITTGAPMPGAGSTITIAGTGNGNFSMNYAHAGSYKYQIVQTAGATTGYAYDTAVFEVVVYVTNVGGGGLTHTLIISKDGGKTSSVAFQNTYTAPVVPPIINTGTLTISNSVTGAMGDANKEFHYTIQIYDELGVLVTTPFPYTGFGVPGGNISSGDNIALKGGQSIVIRDLPVGYQYVVTQTDADTDGYSTSGQGSSGTITAEGNTSAWVNHKPGISDPTPVDVTFSGLKSLDMAVPNTNAFVFYLKDSSGHVLQQINNLGDMITFAPVRLTQEGTYTYYLSEQIGSGAYLYDTTVHTVVVTVTKVGNALQAQVTYDGGATPPTFNNTTQATGGGGGGARTVLIQKIWEDNMDAQGKRPSSVTLHLKINGVEVQTISLSAANGWQAAVTIADTGTILWEEDEIEGYTTTIGGSLLSGYQVINRYTTEEQRPHKPQDPHNPVEDDPDDPGSPGMGGDNPQTGDSMTPLLWTILGISALAGIFLALFFHRKIKES